MSEQAIAASTPQVPSVIPVAKPAVWRRAIPIVIAALLTGAFVAVAVWLVRPSVLDLVTARFSYPLPEGQTFTDPFLPSVAISPDGTQIAYVANKRLYLRSISELDARPIPGTDTQTNMGGPVFSPDGQSIAYWIRTGPAATRLTGLRAALKRIATSGGAPITIAEIDNVPLGVRWQGDAILFGQVDHGVMKVAASGGKPEVLVKGKTGEATMGPQLLPGVDALLFSVAASQDGTVTAQEPWDQGQVVVQSMKSGERKVLVTGGSDARYLPTGHVVYALGGVLFAVPFNVKRLEVTGGPVPVVEGVLRTGVGLPVVPGSAHVSVSNNGSIVYVPGPMTAAAGQRGLVLIDRSGHVEELKVPAHSYESPRVSPDGRRIAVFTDDGKEAIVWIYDLSGATAIRRLTLEGKNRAPIWSSDSQHVAFQSDREGDLAIFWQRADGSTRAERLTKPEKGAVQLPEAWSPDGTTLLFSEAKGDVSSLWALSLKDRTAKPFGDVRSAVSLSPSGDFSRDGRWVAYSVRAPGARTQVFVEPFPTTGAKYLVADGAGRPQWTPDGKALAFASGATRVTVVAVTSEKGVITFGNPELFWDTDFNLGPGGTRSPLGRFHIMPDGKRIVSAALLSLTGASRTPHMEVVLNWFEELKRRVPSPNP